MESSRFDALTRGFAAAASRRRALGALAALAVAPLAADAKPTPNAPEPVACLAIGKRCSLPAAAGADHGKGKHGGKAGKRKHHPPACAKCCSRYGAAGPDGKARCTCKGDGEACANPSQCCGGLCKNGHCTACPDGLTACAGKCVDLQTNDQHCGACTNPCASGQRCVGGHCVCDGTSCPRGCCQNGSCQRGTSDQACGIDGADCQTCATCTTCDGTQCVNATACCGNASVCQGGTCVACGAHQRCQGGQCVCDATSCPNGCCTGSTCVPFAQQTKQQCGTGGAACQACAGFDTCGGGNPGTPGVCGCTRQCAGKTCGDADACGGTCDGPCLNECQTCASGVCQNKDNRAACGGPNSGLHCCNGVCPPPPTCIATGACCPNSDINACVGLCCGQPSVDSGTCSGTGFPCVASAPGGPCHSDADCSQLGGPAICRCGVCCGNAGTSCGMHSQCCSNVCDGTGRCQ